MHQLCCTMQCVGCNLPRVYKCANSLNMTMLIELCVAKDSSNEGIAHVIAKQAP